jgi:hypothetical protein
MREKWLSVAGAIALAGLTLVLVMATQSSAAPSQADRAAAALPTDPDFEIYDQRLPWTNEQHPDVAYNPDKDEYLVVFDWDFNGGGDHDVMGITVTAAGVPAQNPIPISTGTDYDDAYPSVAYNPDAGSYLVAWQRSYDADTYYAIGGSIVTEMASTPFNIYGTIHGAQRYPDVAYGPGPGRFLVVWENHGPYTLPPDIFGTTLDGAGSNMQSIRISPDDATPGEQTYPAVANNEATGRWLVVWNDTRTGGTTGHDIYGQQVQYASGSVSLWGSVVSIGTIAAEAGAPAVDWGPVGGGNGEFLTVWNEGDYGMYARRVRANNTLVGDPIAVSNTEIDKANVAVAYANGSNDWWVAWESG